MTLTSTLTPQERLQALGLVLPDVPAPVAVYVPAVFVPVVYEPAVDVTGTVYTSGQLPFVDGDLMATGKVGGSVDEETAIACARQAALNAVAAICAVVGGDLSAVTRVVRVGVFVASDPSFTGQARVANGASELLGAVFGDAGEHVRTAVGVAVLPLDAPVEVEVVVQV